MLSSTPSRVLVIMKREAMSMNLHLPAMGLFSKIAKEVMIVHDWLAGPPMSEHDRLGREIAASEGWRRVR